MKLRVSSFYIDEDSSYRPYSGYLVDVDIISFEDISDVIDLIGEDELLGVIGSKKMCEHIDIDEFISSKSIDDIIRNNEEAFLDAILKNMKPSDLLDYVSEDDILAKARDINIDKI